MLIGHLNPCDGQVPKEDSKNDVQSNTVFLALVPCLASVFVWTWKVISEVVICLNARSERDATDFF